MGRRQEPRLGERPEKKGLGSDASMKTTRRTRTKRKRRSIPIASGGPEVEGIKTTDADENRPPANNLRPILRIARALEPAPIASPLDEGLWNKVRNENDKLKGPLVLQHPTL